MADAVVKSVDPFSIAEECGIEKGDVILKVNNKEFTDVLDFRFLTSDEHYVVEVKKGDGSIEEIEVYNELYEQFGCEFENSLMDSPKTCRNKCIFCFMDQLPPNMRKTMYFKDDDVRLSFLEGNYVTLTNLSEEETDRICSLKISPINVSVHATDPDLRCKMLNNRFAGNVLSVMERFAKAGIMMNAQIVLCKGINDGEFLKRSLLDLAQLFPYIRSISVVPVGLTSFREGLFPLEAFQKEDCNKVIDEVTNLGNSFLEKYGTRLVYLADEFYIKAQRELPCFDYYEDFPQIENGVGLMTTMNYEIAEALANVKFDVNPCAKSIATSEIAYDYVCLWVKSIKEKCPALNVNVYKIKYNFFGGKITVTGLLCGSDIIGQLKGKDIGEELLLSESMFKDDCDILLDDVTKDDIERELGVKVIITPNTGYDFVKNILKGTDLL